MKIIDLYNKESFMIEHLTLVYKEYWNRMIWTISSLRPEEINRLSNPFFSQLSSFL